jgi:hypothetical protein
MQFVSKYKTFPKIILILCFLLNVSISSAQSEAHPILDRMDLYVASGKVYVTCIVSKGYTCFGIELNRSADSLNYETVDIEYGICGSELEPTFFSFVDDNPPKNQKLFYRLDLGGFGYTTVIETRVVDIQEFGYRITPNPASDYTEVHFANINKSPVEVSIIDLGGNLIYKETTLESYLGLATAGFRAGIYTIIIENQAENHLVRAKLVVAN